jgi:hypothetical protein
VRPAARAAPFLLAALAVQGTPALFLPPAAAQTLDARRLAMGGVAWSGFEGSAAENPAYRTVPREGDRRSVTLPLGLVQFAFDHPPFDPEDENFSAFALADLFLNPPIHLRMVKPDPPSDDVRLFVGRDSLTIGLGDLRRVLHGEVLRRGTSVRAPLLGAVFDDVYLGISPAVHAEEQLRIDRGLLEVLDRGEAVESNAVYRGRDIVEAQAGLALNAIYARAFPFRDSSPAPPPRLSSFEEAWRRSTGVGDVPREKRMPALHLGTGLKYIYGLAYLGSDTRITFTTPDTLFGDDALDVGFDTLVRTAVPEGAGPPGNGFGLDLGAVYVSPRWEVGLAVRDAYTRVRWKTDLNRDTLDTRTNDVLEVPIARNEGFTAAFPATAILAVARRTPRALVAVDVTRDVVRTVFHAGVEIPFAARIPLRLGTSLDGWRRLQFSGGSGVPVGPVDLDLALFTHSRNLAGERALDLAVSIAWRPGEPR